MIPASFGPMLLKLVFPKLIEKLEEHKREIIEHIFKIGKLKENNDYRELPNDCDRRVDKLEEQFKLIAKDIHPPVIPSEDWEQMKKDMKKIKNTKMFKRGK